jgi:type IV pilus assembly protein PilA
MMPPPPNQEHGFTLIELMIVIAIIGVLVAVGLPAYQDYIARAQMKEPVHLMSGAITSLAVFHATYGRWPNVSEVYTGISGRYTDHIDGSSSGGLNYTMNATMKSSGINERIKGKKVSLQTQNGGVSWNCGPTPDSSDAVSGAYLPGTCREVLE